MQNGDDDSSSKDGLDNYELLDQIGSGSYATVHRAISKRTRELCAIKKLVERAKIEDITNEIDIISNSVCDNIVKFLDCGCAQNGPMKGPFIVMEYCNGGSIRDAMRLLERPMTYREICAIVRGVLNGLDYLHRVHPRTHIHRDVKSANILLHKDGHAKLVDFGVSEPYPNQNKPRDSIMGTPLWLPPEVINRDPKYSTAIDIWSLGITIIEMGDMQPPYADLGHETAWQEIKDLNKSPPSFRNPARWPHELNDFLALCLVKTATKRKSAKELLTCEIMRNTQSPSREIIELVVEIRETSFSTSNQPESRLLQFYDDLSIEGRRMFTKYCNRKMEVIHIAHKVELISDIKKEFKALVHASMEKNARVNEAKGELEKIKEKRRELEIKKTDLETEYNDKVKLRKQLQRGLQQLKMKH